MRNIPSVEDLLNDRIPKGLWMKADGEVLEVAPASRYWSLAELQKFVGGWIEHLQLGGLTMIVNEEGKLHNLPFNQMATGLCILKGHRDQIVGDVLLTTMEYMDTGEDDD